MATEIVTFTVAQVSALHGGKLPDADGFDWNAVEHFKLEGGALEPYSGDQILPGPGIPVHLAHVPAKEILIDPDTGTRFMRTTCAECSAFIGDNLLPYNGD